MEDDTKICKRPYYKVEYFDSSTAPGEEVLKAAKGSAAHFWENCGEAKNIKSGLFPIQSYRVSNVSEPQKARRSIRSWIRLRAS